VTPATDHEGLARLQQRLAAHPGPPGDPERQQLAALLARRRGEPLDWMALAFEFFSGYRFGDGHAALAQAIRRAPNMLAAHWLHFQFPASVAPASDAEADEFRRRWQAGLSAFERLDFTHPQWRSQAWGCIGACTAFYRHYVGDCIDEQRRYGALVHRMMAALDPGEPQRPMRKRRKVFFCSPYFHDHTVGRLFLPLIESLDPRTLDVHCLHFGSEDDDLTAQARAVGTFHGGPRDPAQWRQLIAEQQPDVIVYLDIGMHPLPQALAALRLAPVQACLWGHPVTTGLPTLDYVLSPDRMEPADAQHHYTERLLRLPGLGHGMDVGASTIAADIGRDGPAELICAQSVYKLMPQQDALFARILAGLPGSRLHFVPHPQAHVREQLRERMRPAMESHGVDADRQLVMHGYRPLSDFLALAAQCSLNLDSIGWSGGMSSLDLLRLGLPTVTLPGTSMRSRQTASLLQLLDADALVARSESDYVSLAIELGRDRDRRVRLAAQIRAGMPRLDSRAAVAAWLGDFLQTCQPVPAPDHRPDTLAR